MADLNIGNSTTNIIVNAKHNGAVNPQIDNTYDLGTSTLRWKNIYGGTFMGSLNGNAATATKATQDSAGQQINTTYIKDLSVSGRTITYTKGDGSTGTITTQDNNTTYSAGTGLSLSGTTFNHKNSVTAGTAQGDASKTLTFSGTFTIPTITYDAQGHITGKGTTTMTMPANPNTDTKVTQTAINAADYTNWRPLIWGSSNSATEGFTPSTVIDGVYTAQTLSCQPATGTIRANTFKGNLNGNATTMSYPLGFSIRELNNWTNGDFTYDGFTTFVTDWAEPSGGSIYWASNSNGQLAAGIDGYFYQGRDVRDKKLHRCLDTYDLSNSKWGNSDKVDGYHASQLLRSDGGVWDPGANISLNASGNRQEWSFDIHRNGYTGCYWHVWDESRGTMLKVTPDDGKVSAPYGFVGTVEGPAWYLSNTSHNISISKSDWGASNPWGCTNRTLVWGQRGYNGSYSPDSADIVLYYGNTGASGGAGWFLHIDGGIYSMGGVYGAVWNDYAEFRESTDEQPGRVVMEDSKGICQRTNERLQPFAGIISDTFGFSEGKTDKATTPLAVAGRVLAYPYQNRNNYKPGDCVCAAPNGTVDIMTREEVREWPDRIVGTVSEIPSYETWGTGNVEVNGRIWIKVK